MGTYKKIKKIAICMLFAVSVLIPLSVLFGTNKTPLTYLPIDSQTTVNIKETPSLIRIYSDFTFTKDIHEPIVVMADNIVIDGNGFTLQGSDTYGFYLNSRKNVTIKNVIIKGWIYGILLWSSSDNLISKNNITENRHYGISLVYSSNNKISGNQISKTSWFGLISSHSSNNYISENFITKNNYGIRAIYSTNNSIFENYIMENTILGIEMSFSSNNLIYHNNIINNSNQALDRSPTENNWYHPDLLEGNYWSDYLGVDDGSGIDKHSIAGDGIGDTNIPHPYSDFDTYPFMDENGWMKQEEEKFEGYGMLRIDRKWFSGKAKLFLSENMIRIEVNDQTASWEIMKHCEMRNLEYYYGTGEFGRIFLLILRKDTSYVFAMGRRVFFRGKTN